MGRERAEDMIRKAAASLGNAFPVIAFFILSFLFVYSVYGLHYTIAVPPMAAFFSAFLRKEDSSCRDYLLLLFHETVLLVLASLGSLGIAAATVLNILVPFALVFTQSTQFNPKGYYIYMLLFVYMSFVPPVDLHGFLLMLLSLWSLTALMAAGIWIWRRRHPSSEDDGITMQELFGELSALTDLLIADSDGIALRQRFSALMQEVSSSRPGFSAFSSCEIEIGNMMSTMLQRFSYMIADLEWRSELDSAHMLEMRRLSSFLSATSRRIGTKWQGSQIAEAQQLLDSMAIPEGRIRIFIRSILHMADLMLNTAETSRDRVVKYSVDWMNLRHEIAMRFSRDAFEMRFASRLAAVMAISGIANYLLPTTHSYWIPLNAFLLLQPSSEDSSYHMRTNPIGTFIGCLAEYMIYPFLPGLGGEMAFALLMISFMYCSKPGTWYHPAFHTCYTLTMALITLGESTAIALRLMYLGIAVAIVFIVNRFFFPIRQASQFRYSIKAMFRLHNSYWDIIRKGLVSHTDLSVSTDILTDFHMYYEESISYIRKHPEIGSGKELEEAIVILWHMFSELEQIHYLVRIKSIRSDENSQILSLITAIQKDLYPIIRCEDFPSLYDVIHLQRPDIAYVIGEYLKNAERLLQYRDCIPF